jgi:phospholipase/carboxylesterase
MTLTTHDDLSLKYVLSVPSGKPDHITMPLVIVLHGRGADANDLADIAPSIDGAAGYRFVFPNAPNAFPWGGFSWFDGLPPEVSSVVASRKRLLHFLDEVIERYPVTNDQVILAGFSQGGMMSLDSGFRTEKKLCGIVVMSGLLFEQDAPDFAARRDQRVFIAHGTADDVIPVLAARRARALLEAAGVRPEYHEFPIGHNVSMEELALIKAFMKGCVDE